MRALSLDNTANQAINLSGSASINAPSCSIAANSNSSSAVNMSGSATLTASCLVAVGGLNVTSGLTLKSPKCTVLRPAPQQLLTLMLLCRRRTASGSCLTVPNTSSVTLSPGNYCSGINIGGSQSATFQPGLYYVNGNFAISGSATATGTGVTFFITKGNTAAISGGTVTSFSTPTSGTYPGIVFFGDRTATNGNNDLAVQAVPPSPARSIFRWRALPSPVVQAPVATARKSSQT
jgi:hypothetical protein